MKISSCLLVGCGGIGSILIEPLCRLLSYHPDGTDNIVVADGDRVEPKNLVRQLFPNNQVWRDKVLAISRRLNTPNIIYINKYINNNNIDDIFSYLLHDEMPVIIGAVDNAATRNILIQNADLTYDNYIWICPSNSWSIAQTSLYIKKNGQSLLTHPFQRYKNLANPTDTIPSKGCIEEQESTPQLITANHLAAHFTLQYVTNILYNKILYPELMGNIETMEFKSVGNAIKEY